MRDSWIRWMGSVGEERDNSEDSEVFSMTRKQFLLKTGWIFWFSYQKSELGGREALKQFLSPSFSVHTQEALTSTNTEQPVAPGHCSAPRHLLHLHVSGWLRAASGIGLVQQDP